MKLNLWKSNRTCGVIVAFFAGLCLSLLMLPRLAEAQTAPVFIGETCTFQWDANTETDLAGYRAWAVRQGTPTVPALPIVTINKTATSHPTSTTCAALGITADGTYQFNVLAFDLAGNSSPTTSVLGTRDGVGPAAPRNPRLSSTQPVAMTITPNPIARQATVAWNPGTCQREFIVSRLVSSQWVEVGRTRETWMNVPLVNQVNQPYGVSAVCEG